jgi:hypothetical protein
MTGESQLTSSAIKSMMMSTTKSTQKSTNSSWMPPPLSKIVPYASNGLRHLGAQKVSLTLKGWVPSPPMPSGAHALMTKKKMVKELLQRPIDVGINSEEEVMKQPSGIRQEDD